MDRQEYEWLLSGLGELDRLLAMTPESAVIDRMSLESERERIAEKLAGFTPPARWPATALLTFDGDPAQGRRSINAAFALKAVERFGDAVAAAGASLVSPPPDQGPIPNRDDYRLLVSTAAARSFGFQIEEANPSDGPDPSPTERGIEQVHTLLKAAAACGDGDSDDNGNDSIAAAHPRALAGVHDFLKLVANHPAVCGLAYNRDRFRFRDTAQVKRSLDALNRLTSARK